jgi:hypothetical protein
MSFARQASQASQASSPQNTYLLRSQNYNLSLRHVNHSFIIGFLNKQHVQQVRKVVHLNTDIELTSYITTNQAKLINDMMLLRGLPNPKIDNINICDDARISISKKININKLPCSIEVVPFGEFVMYPFSKNLGIVLIEDLVDENQDRFLFQAQVAEPSFNPSMFQG